MAKRLTSLRVSDYSTAQIEQLSKLMSASQSEIILLAVDRMYRQEIGGNPMKKEENTMNDRTYYISEEMLGDQADETDARRMVEILSARGYDVQLGHPRSYQSDDDIATKDWEEGLDIISKEKHN